MSTCNHEGFDAFVDVHRLKNDDGTVGAFVVDVRVFCTGCRKKFMFLGLPQGLDIGGAAVSYDRTEAHLTISPDGRPPTNGLRGFTIRKADDGESS